MTDNQIIPLGNQLYSAAPWPGAHPVGGRLFRGAADEPSPVGAHLTVVAERCQRGVEDSGGSGISGRADAVVHPFAFPARGDDSSLAKGCQVPRDFGLALAENLHKVTDTDLPACHQIEQTQADRVRQGCVEFGQRERMCAARHA